MRFALLIPLVFILTAWFPVEILAQRRAMTTDDGLNMVQVNNALISPDGSRVFYRKSELDWDKNKRKNTYYMISTEGGEPYQYIGEDGGSNFQFSPDGTYISFKRTVDKKSQLFYMRTAGGEAIQLSKHESAVGSYHWAHDEKSIFFVAEEPRTKEEEKEHENGLDAIWVGEGPNGQNEGRWNNFWSIEIGDDKKPIRLSEGDRLIGAFDISAQDDRIVFTSRSENRRNQGNLSELYVMSLEDSTISRLTDNKAPESRPIWAPDGQSFAFMAADDKQWELRNSKIWVMNPVTKSYRLVSGAYEGSIRRIKWMPNSNTIQFSGLQKTNSNLYNLEIDSGQINQLTSMTGTMNVQDFSKDGTMVVYSFEDVDTPSDLYVSTTDQMAPTRLTRANPAVEDSLLHASLKVVQWKSKDGLDIEGVLLLPPDYQEGTRLPLLLHIHGGPAGVFTNRFDARYHIWAGLGYAQLLPNVRGSSGYTDDILRGNIQDIGGGDYQDLMTGVDYVIKEGYVDADRMGVRGWSYGGILGGWTITQTDRFKGASLGAMVSDWTSEYGPGFNHDVRLWYIGDTPWENPEGWRQRSALTHIKNVKTPVLLLHGMSDPVDTEPQSMMFYSALKDQGKPVRYIRFPRELHGFREPRHQRTRDIEEIRWIQKHVLGIEWTPWERAKKEEEKEEEKKVVQ
jgi:dipeptidyl aminopeptidase/acylaminoacyl peptidase